MSNKTNTTTLTCPACGEELTINVTANTNHNCVNQQTVIVTNQKPTHQQSKAAARIAMLKEAGVDTTGFFAMGDNIMKIGANYAPVCIDDDPIVVNIIAKGSVPNRYLFDRFTLSHFINLGVRVEDDKYVRDSDGKVYISRVRSHIEALGYDYAWRVVEMKLKRLAACQYKNDTEGTEQTKRWYNKSLVLDMFDHYVEKYHEYLNVATYRKCKGRGYVAIDATGMGIGVKQGVFVTDLDSIRKFHENFRYKIFDCESDADLYHVVKEWNKIRIRLGGDVRKRMRFELKPAESWVNAYEGYGAFFSMLNLIRFHGAQIHERKYDVYGDTTRKLDQFESEAKLSKWAEDHKDESWWLTGAFKHLVDDNGIDVELKKEEWRKAKLAKIIERGETPAF